MEDVQSRRLEALLAHIEGLEAALDALEAEGSLESLRRLARSLARAADESGQAEVAARARTAQDAADPDLPAASRALLGSILALRPEGTEGHHVLVVEDNATVATALLAYLKEDGRTLYLAASAAKAEQVLASHLIDLVILDLILPDRDGRDLLLQLREDPRTAGVPVIVLSARAGAVTRAECLAVGADAFLEKPADPERLRREVALHLSEHRREADARLDRATGLLNRAGLSEAYRALRSRSGKVEGPLAVALLVVEPLEQVVSTLGRDAADGLVRAVAEHVRSALGQRDDIGRWGDAELLALLPGTSAPDARHLLEEGLTRVATGGTLDEHRAAGVELGFWAGVGVADTGTELRDVAFAAEQSMQRARREGARLTFAPESATPAKPPVVLLVEDDRVTATLIQHRLVREGFEVMDFLNGEDAFRWAAEAPFDLAILDVKVPGMDGFEILERVRAIPRLADVPIIMLTGLGSEADVVRGLELGANDYMLKPFSPAELLARVRRLAEESLGKERARSARRGDASGTSAR